MLHCQGHSQSIFLEGHKAYIWLTSSGKCQKHALMKLSCAIDIAYSTPVSRIHPTACMGLCIVVTEHRQENIVSFFSNILEHDPYYGKAGLLLVASSLAFHFILPFISTEQKVFYPTPMYTHLSTNLICTKSWTTSYCLFYLFN